jgi:NAD(P)-dependent dehydrogenase (short-subunit alcohol dehydrogenase family)
LGNYGNSPGLDSIYKIKKRNEMAKRLKDKVAVAFGAGSCGPGWGNGKAAAVAYAREGARVIAVDIDLDKSAETKDIIQSEQGECLAVAGDVTVAADIDKVIKVTLQEYGTIDILHYNVGIGSFKSPTELSEDDWDRVIDTNLKGLFLACKRILPIMEDQRSGVITAISSVAGLAVGPIPYVSYYASKAGLNHFIRAIAVAYAAKGIRANTIAPGLIHTPLLYKEPGFVEHYGSPEALVEARDAMSPTGKMGDAWDIANAAVFLASSEASYINGVVLPVDGGLSCRLG